MDDRHRSAITQDWLVRPVLGSVENEHVVGNINVFNRGNKGSSQHFRTTRRRLFDIFKNDIGILSTTQLGILSGSTSELGFQRSCGQHHCFKHGNCNTTSWRMYGTCKRGSIGQKLTARPPLRESRIKPTGSNDGIPHLRRLVNFFTWLRAALDSHIRLQSTYLPHPQNMSSRGTMKMGGKFPCP